MVSRRSLLFGGLAAPLALVAARRTADARQLVKLKGRVYTGRPQARSGRYTRPILLRGGHVVLDARLSMSSGRVFSISNANDRYVGVAQLAAQPKEMPFLVVKGGAVRAESWGTGFGAGGNQRGAASFHLDRALADEVAALWHTQRRDRVPLGAGLSASWAPRGRFVAGRPMEMVLTLRNTGAVPVWLNLGGRQRGKRDNRFAFDASKDGKPLPVIDAPDFGGLGSNQALAPGASVERTADLADWVAIDRPGTYRVRCRYELELTASQDGASWPDHGHETWDWASDAVLDIPVG